MNGPSCHPEAFWEPGKELGAGEWEAVCSVCKQPKGTTTLDTIFALLQEESLEMHGLCEERNAQHPTGSYGSAPWNCRLVYRFIGSDGVKLWPMYCYGYGNSAGEAIMSAVADARRLRSTPWISKGAPAAPAAQLSLEDIGL